MVLYYTYARCCLWEELSKGYKESLCIFSSVHEDPPGKNTGVGCHALLQGIFPTQVSHIAGRFFTD